MKTFRAVLGIMIVQMLLTPQLSAQHYYSNSQQWPLKIDSLKICLKFNDTIGVNDQAIIFNSIGRIIEKLVDDHVVDGFVVCSLSTRNGYDSFLDSVQLIDGVSLVESYYLTTFDSVFLVGNRFCAAFDISTPKSVIDSINTAFGVVIQYEMESMPNVFVLLNNRSTGYRILDLANLYYELPQTRYAHPLFGIRPELSSYNLYDFYNDYQPHIKKVIGEFNFASVWDFAGLTDSIVVAVVDDGISDDVTGHAAHEDLPASRVLPGKNFAVTTLPAIPGPQQFHGMACAGIICATHTTDSISGLDTNSGVISVAPHVKILPIKIFYDNGDGVGVDTLADAINYAWQNGAHVLSNSWGYTFSTCLSYPVDLVDDAIQNAFFTGRAGKGCPVIFAAGNRAESTTPVRYPGCVPAAYAVGAIHLEDDTIWNYSNYDSSLDIVAPSGDAGLQGDFWSIDQANKNGVNHPGGIFNCQLGHPEVGDYICNFGGTSAAAPIVSGVAALLISKDSNLTAQEIYSILDSSALKDLDWGPLPDTPHVEYGWGRVDAFRAILSISRGDLDNDGNIGTNNDLTFMVDYIFRGGPLPFPSPLMGDCNCDGDANNVIDMTFLVDFIYRGSGIPPINPCYEF